MQVRLTVWDPARAAPGVDVLVTAPVGTPLRDLRVPLLDVVGAEHSARLSVDGPLGDDAALGLPPLLDAAVVTVTREDDPPSRTAPSRALLELHVIAGPDAGQVHPLRPGRHRLGRSPAAEVTIADSDVSRVHALLDVTAAGVRVSDEGSTNGTELGGEHVGRDAVPLPLGVELRVGRSVLVLRLPEWHPAAVTSSGCGTTLVNRPPRLWRRPSDVEVILPVEPEEPRPSPFPTLAVVLPVLVSIPLALLWSPFALLFGLTTPVLMLANVFSDRRSGRRRYAGDLDEYRVALSDAAARSEAALAVERRHREASSPDPAMLLVTVSVPLAGLWARRPGDDDYLCLRVGLGTVSSGVTQVLPSASPAVPQPLPLHDAPLAIPLARTGVLALAGPQASVDGLTRHLLAQLAALHSPHDVHLALLSTDPSRASAWGWLRWLPHLCPSPVDGPLLATDPAVATQLAERLRRLVEAREAAPRHHTDHRRPATVVVLLDDVVGLRELPGVADVLTRGPAVGVHAIATARTSRDLPGTARATVQLGGEGGSDVVVNEVGADTATGTADLVSQSWAERFARGVGPLRDASPSGGTAGVPDVSHLLEVLHRHTGTDPLDVPSVVRGWERRPRCTTAVLGEHADGVYAPDLTRDGPHVLVGGTTGAGKSELLQSLIAALAVVNRPDELVFLLVDYKGGAAFGECARLPHAVGLVTDLDEHLTRRTLTSLAAEIRRREQVLREAGVKDLEDYQRLTGVEPLPRLVIVVDEFRVLAEELPDFVSGLVRLAAVGRSLGLHLVLATQRPGGAVSPEIRANVNLRIALRVRDGADSVDVVDSPRAASIDPRCPGRALARSGPDDLVDFQVSRVAGTSVSRVATEVSVRRLPWPGTEVPAPRDPEEGPSDLRRLVVALRCAAETVGAAARPPWLPPLPRVVRYAEASAMSTGQPSPTALVIGVADEPDLMRQRPLVVDPAVDPALAVVGASRSGRTSVLLALAAAAARSRPDVVHLYVLGAGPELADVARLPHAGSVVRRADTERAARVLRRLAGEVAQRRQRGEAGPAVLLLVDGWDALHRELEDIDGGGPVEHLLHVLREGPSVGVLPVVAGDRGLLTGRVAGLFGARLVLRPADPTDLLLAGVHSKDVPTDMPPGRGLLLTGDQAVEVQVCLPERDLGVVTGDGPAADPGRLPFVVPPMPDRVTVADLSDDPRTDPGKVLLGVGGDDVRPLGLLPGECRSLVVAGPPGSGRSATLALIAVGLLAAGRPVVLVPPRASPAHGLVPAAVDVALAEDPDRLTALLATGTAAAPTFVLVDDAEAVEGTRTEDALLAHLRAGTAGVVVAGGAAELGARFRGLAAEVRRARTGILLSPTGYADGDVLGVALPRARRVHPGRGHLVRSGTVEQIQVAVVEASGPGGDRGPAQDDSPQVAPAQGPAVQALHADPCADRVPHPSRRAW